MSQPSPTGQRSSIRSPTISVTQNALSHTSGASASAESSRPSTASAIRTEGYGGYGRIAQGGRLGTDAAGEPSSRRHSDESNVQTTSRALGVHSILNHPADLEDREPLNAKVAGHPAKSLAQPWLPAPVESPRSRKRPEPPRSPPREPDHPSSTRMGRRVLTPKSPTVRAASLGPRRTPNFLSNIQQLQPMSGAGGRPYTAGSGPFSTSETPPLPPLAVATGPNLPGLAALEAGQPRSAPVLESPARSLEPMPAPPIDRTSSSQTHFSQIDQNSPTYRYAPGPTPSQPPAAFRVLPAGGAGSFGQEPQLHGPHEGYQLGQASYQMTLDTDQGPMIVPIELDLQQASKVADEKRKRNAGASARFRARRKEKEKEASQTISGLQQELRDLIDERDFYLSERNYFRDLATRHIPAAQILQRPQSPPQRRTVMATAETPGGTLDNANSEDSYHDRSDSCSTAQRRRTGDYQPTFVGRQTHSPPASSSYGTAFLPQPSLPLPPPVSSAFGTPRTLPPGPPPLPPSVTRSQSYDLFRRDHFDRSWSAGAGR